METPISFREGSEADSYETFVIFEHAVSDLVRRMGSTAPARVQDPAAMARKWDERRSLYEHLARTAHRYWIAERSGSPIAFARTIRRGDVEELTELFVMPGQQSGGIGRGLLERAFPTGDAAHHRVIVATPDHRAQTLYLRWGVYPRFPTYYFGREPQVVEWDGDLEIREVDSDGSAVEVMGEIDEVVLGHRRDVDHEWLLQDRSGHLYTRGGQVVGYGYLGADAGPFALLDPADFPVVLSHAESSAASAGRDRFGVEVPMVNQHAVDHLLGRGFVIDSFVTMMMTSGPLGRFENYVLTSPPFFL